MAVDVSSRDMGAIRRRRSLMRDVVGFGVIVLAAAIGYFAFPDNLALLTRIIAVALLVLSLDLVTGYCGVATLGHAALFGSGAYAAGILSAHYGINDPLLMTLAGLVGGTFAGLLSGLVMLRAHGLPQLVLSIALIHLFHELANKMSSFTGGSDGLSGIAPDPIFGRFEFDLFGNTAYVFAVVMLLVVFVLLRILVRSPFGMLCRGLKEDPLRIRAMGASPKRAIVKMYGISGAVAGLGGALNAISTQVVGLDTLSFTQSAEALVMLALGGTGSLFGALAGTVAFMMFQDYVSSVNPFHWLTMVGALLIAVVLFAPKGIYGTVAAFLEKRREGRP
ncbi:branched-chain amino acid ABC transporter permease [Neorhizobium sp. DAR64861/K0K2]|uniref:branched-chain amino acid ABC transporter permease n=1 Tax=unclassified Neorhizobium TaxID=2629175 RepID=UPI003D2835C3